MFQKVHINTVLHNGGAKGHVAKWSVVVDAPDGASAAQLGLNLFRQSEMFKENNPRRYFVSLVDGTVSEEDKIEAMKREVEAKAEAEPPKKRVAKS